MRRILLQPGRRSSVATIGSAVKAASRALAKTIAVATLLGSLVSESAAQTPEGLQEYREGLRAYHASRYEEALSQLRPYAERGYELACEYVGLIYSVGLSVVADPEQARRWLTCAARQGASES